MPRLLAPFFTTISFQQRAKTLLWVVLSIFLAVPVSSAQQPWRESPYLLPRVAAGLLPPVQERLPPDPLVTDVAVSGREAGRYGGTLRLLIQAGNDARVLYPFGYARLVTYDESYAIVPDILERVDVFEDRLFVLHLRRGHRWSDGEDFSAEDFRFYWQDVANNRDLSPDGPPSAMLVNGLPPRFDVVDPWTVRFSWNQANPGFLPLLAAASPLEIYRPAHYLKQFHAKHQDQKKLAIDLKKSGLTSWAEYYWLKDQTGLMTNPDLPSLQPWVVQKGTENDTTIIARRNPYFHRVDQSGRQLPYIDRVALIRTPPDAILRTTLGGGSDLQASGLSLDDVPALNAAVKRDQLSLYLWPSGRGSHLAIYPNLTMKDKDISALLRDPRFRRALSLGIDREKIKREAYNDTGVARANTLLPDSPLFDPDAQSKWIDYDPARARELLDELGLTVDHDIGARRLPNGKILSLPITSIASDARALRILQNIRDDWQKLNIELLIEPPAAGTDIVAVLARSDSALYLGRGIDNGLTTADDDPSGWVPASPHQPQWPLWGLYQTSDHTQGIAVDDDIGKNLLALREDWRHARNVDQRREAWRKIIMLHADNVLSIGLVGAVPQPVAVNRKLRNVPVNAYYNWEPGAYFGIHRPDLMWFDRP